MDLAPDVREALEHRRRAVDAALDAALPPETAWPETIHRAVRYSLFAGGKRIRPLLVLAAGEAVGAVSDDVMPLACAVEMIHTYSLIHDDLPAMDNDDLRRGRLTSHKVFGEAMAVLAGDALLTAAFELLSLRAEAAEDGQVRRHAQVLAMLGAACGTQGLIGGQVMDIESEGKALAPSDLERLHRAKTGALLGACVRGGALIGGGTAEDVRSMEVYAGAIGLAFQVVDDVLDATASSEQLGKTAGKDAQAHKATYVSIHGLDQARRMAAELLDEALAALVPFGSRGRFLEALARIIVVRGS